jgi:hypothetical protein
MTAQVDATVTEGIVHVSIRGHAGALTGGEAVMKALWHAHRSRSRCLLFDIREALHPERHAQVVQHAANAVKNGIAAYRIAVVGLEGDALLDFIEDVAANRGLRARTFTDLEAARDWLRPARRSRRDRSDSAAA